ncbi:VanZ family protein [Paraclostridium sordellii]
MSRLYNSLSNTTMYSMLCIILPCLIYQIINIKKNKLKKEKILTSHLIWVYIFLLYIYLALSVAGIGSIWDILQYGGIIGINEINLIPFRSEGITTYILNIIMFMPLGFLLPVIWNEFRSIKKVVFTGLSFSLAIEICQLFNYRATDIDDLLMNTLGAFLGYFIWISINNILIHNINNKAVYIEEQVYEKQSETTNNTKISLSKNEANIYLTLSILGQFLLYNWNFVS